MYFVLADNRFLHMPVSQNAWDRIISGKAVHEVEKNGTMDLVIPGTNREYNNLQERKTVVRLIRSEDGTEECIYQGLYLEESDGLNFEKEIKTDGFLVVLNDTNIRPYNRTTSPKDEFIALINEHNQRTDTFKKLTIGNITVSGTEVHRINQGYQKTKDAIDELLSAYGGYVQIRTTGNRFNGFTTYIDWLSELSDLAEQKIRYGKNIIDITRHINTDDVMTRIIPLGTETDGIPTTIKSVNNGVDYLSDSDAISKYGIIEKIVSFDIESPTKLKEAGQSSLEANKLAKLTIEVTAIDLADAGYNVQHLKIGDWVHCIAPKYNIDRWMQIIKYELDIIHIDQSKIVLGETLQTFTKLQSNLNVNALRSGLKTVQSTAIWAGNSAANAVTVAAQASQQAADTAQEVLQIKGSLITKDDIYPIGSIYTSISNINPGDLFGGTWQEIKIADGYFSWVRVKDTIEEQEG